MTSRRRTTSNQRWNNVVYVNDEQRRINFLYSNVDINNVRPRRNNVIFNVEFHNVDQSRNNVLNINICKKLKRTKKFWDSKKKKKKIEIEYTELQV